MKIFELNNIGLKIHYGVTKEGLRYYFIPNPDLNVFYATINVDFGANVIEYKNNVSKAYKEAIPGVAHYLEHLLFNKEHYDVFKEFSKLGASNNACTSYEKTYYEVFGSKNFKRVLEILMDVVFKPYFTEELVNNEKGIILEEEKSARNNPYYEFIQRTKENLLFKDTYRNRVIGSAKTIKKISLKDIETIYEDYYYPQNMFVLISGNFNINEAESTIKEYLAKAKLNTNNDTKKRVLKEPKKVCKSFDEVYLKIEIPKVKVSYKFDDKIFKDYPEIEKIDYVKLLLRANFGTTSKLKSELLKKGLITSNINYSFNAKDGAAIVSLSAETYYPTEVEALLTEQFNNLEITKEDVELHKKYMLKSYILDSDDAISIHNLYQDLIFLNKKKAFFDMYDYIKKFNINTTNKIIMLLKKYNKMVVIAYPKK